MNPRRAFLAGIVAAYVYAALRSHWLEVQAYQQACERIGVMSDTMKWFAGAEPCEYKFPWSGRCTRPNHHPGKHY